MHTSNGKTCRFPYVSEGFSFHSWRYLLNYHELTCSYALYRMTEEILRMLEWWRKWCISPFGKLINNLYSVVYIKPRNVLNVKEYFGVFVSLMDMYVDAWLAPFYVFNDKIICSSDGVCFCCYSWIKLCWNNILWGKHIIIGRIIKLKYPYRTK